LKTTPNMMKMKMDGANPQSPLLLLRLRRRSHLAGRGHTTLSKQKQFTGGLTNALKGVAAGKLPNPHATTAVFPPIDFASAAPGDFTRGGCFNPNPQRR